VIALPHWGRRCQSLSCAELAGCYRGNCGIGRTRAMQRDERASRELERLALSARLRVGSLVAGGFLAVEQYPHTRKRCRPQPRSVRFLSVSRFACAGSYPIERSAYFRLLLCTETHASSGLYIALKDPRILDRSAQHERNRLVMSAYRITEGSTIRVEPGVINA
jgi:hypothetical protein